MNFDPSKKLTKREYLGEGFFHFFKNNKDGEVVSVECTREEYEALGLPNAGPAVLKGHTWLYSDGGTIRVDTESGFLGKGEYAVKDGEVIVCTDKGEVFLPVDAVSADNKLDMSKLPQK